MNASDLEVALDILEDGEDELLVWAIVMLELACPSVGHSPCSRDGAAGSRSGLSSVHIHKSRMGFSFSQSGRGVHSESWSNAWTVNHVSASGSDSGADHISGRNARKVWA